MRETAKSSGNQVIQPVFPELFIIEGGDLCADHAGYRLTGKLSCQIKTARGILSYAVKQLRFHICQGAYILL